MAARKNDLTVGTVSPDLVVTRLFHSEKRRAGPADADDLASMSGKAQVHACANGKLLRCS